MRVTDERESTRVKWRNRAIEAEGELTVLRRQVSELTEAADEAFNAQITPSMLGILSPTDTEERISYERYQTIMNRTQSMLYSMYNKARHAPRQEDANVPTRETT